MRRLVPPVLALCSLLACGTPAHAASSYQGRLQIRHYDDMAADRSSTRYELVGGKHDEALSLSQMPRVRSGSRVTVVGHARHGRIVGAIKGGAARAAAVTPGPRTTAVVLINFYDDTRQPWTVDQVRQRVFTAPDSTNAFFQDES